MKIVYLERYGDFFKKTDVLATQIMGDEETLVPFQPFPGHKVDFTFEPVTSRATVLDALDRVGLTLAEDSNLVIVEHSS